MNGVLLRTAEWNDPRFSRAQYAALQKVATADPQARLLGLDYAHRPVVTARLGIPRSERTYAIQRNGDPTDPKPTSSALGGPDDFIMEEWGSAVPEDEERRSDMSLRPRPGETPEDVLARVTRAAQG